MRHIIIILSLCLTGCVNLQRIKVKLSPRFREVKTFWVHEDSTITSKISEVYKNNRSAHRFHSEGLKIHFNPGNVIQNKKYLLSDSNIIKINYHYTCSKIRSDFKEKSITGWILFDNINPDKKLIKLKLNVKVDGAWSGTTKLFKGRYKFKKNADNNNRL